MENIIEVRNLVKSYKNVLAVNGVDLDVKKGRILGLLGPNGSGKSTIINCILALLKKDSGSIKIYGKEMTPESYDIKEKLGVVFQDVGVYEDLSVYENIDYFCGLYVLDKEKRKALIEETLDLAGLNDFINFKPRELSGGLLRRLNIACGIAHKPEIIIFDEPTVAVDPQSRNNILEGIEKLNKDGATVIYTSHYMDEVEQICDDIIILDKGKVIAEGTSGELKDIIDLGEKISFKTNPLNDQILNLINNIPNFLDITYKDEIYELSFAHGKDNLVNLINILQNNHISYDALTSQRPSLNDVFLALTGKELRD